MSKLTAEQLTGKGMMSIGEVALLKITIAQLPRNPVIVNIGAGEGTSALAMLESRPDAFIFSIDKKRREEEAIALQKAGKLKLNRVWRIMGDSSRVGKHWPFEIDAVFIDGAHHDEAVRADIAAWVPKVKRNGIIYFHDYNHPNVPGLTKIVDKAMKSRQMLGTSRYLVAFRM